MPVNNRMAVASPPEAAAGIFRMPIDVSAVEAPVSGQNVVEGQAPGLYAAAFIIRGRHEFQHIRAGQGAQVAATQFL